MTCDDFQIAIERRLHGDLGEAEAAPLDRHLSSCEACRAYQAQAREVEATMSATAEAILRDVSWDRVREGLRRYRRRVLSDVWSVAAFLCVLYAGVVLLPMRPGNRAETALHNLPLVAGAFAVYALAMLAYVRHLARLADPIELLALYRRRLRSELTWRRRSLWLYPAGLVLVAGVNLSRPDPVRLPGSIAIGLLLLATWAYDRLVKVPRIEREWADLEPRP
jgi:anti-sigma factor RsiW